MDYLNNGANTAAVSSEVYREDFFVKMSREEWAILCFDLNVNKADESFKYAEHRSLTQ
jgi:hypothetical protein